mmetsp:Transcript_105786/g.257002  ORF Transcript_105786/g.257002 Transcript_105786/m.257002 type:complete len:214 (-) Transcript_105786:29-670(-)
MSHNLAVEDALEQDGLRGLCSHVCVRRLFGDKDATDLAQLSVDLVDFHLDGALTNVEDLVCLFEELVLAAHTIGLQCGQRHGLIVAGVHPAAFWVEEGAAAVGGHLKLSAPGEARLELAALTRSNELFDGEEEGHVLAVGQLHGGGQTVDSVVLLEGDWARVKVTVDEGQCVGLARQELGRNKLRTLGCLGLNGKGLGLKTQVCELATLLHRY